MELLELGVRFGCFQTCLGRVLVRKVKIKAKQQGFQMGNLTCCILSALPVHPVVALFNRTRPVFFMSVLTLLW